MNPEIFVITLYLLLIFGIAIYSKIKARNNNENDSRDNILRNEYLADNSISRSESLFSIIATEVSALTFIGIPAFAYGLDYRFIYLYLGAIIGRAILALFYLPKIYGQHTTIYEHMTKSPNSRKFITSIYMVTKLLSIGVRLYSGSILLAEYFEINIYSAIIGLSILTMAYTMIGGLRAVVKTDVIQTFVFISGGIAAHFIIPQVAEMSWSEMIYSGHENNKIFTPNFSYIKIVLVGFLGGIIFDMATHGVDQDFAQRLLATKSLKDAQFSITMSSFLSIFVGLLFLSIGTLLWVYHQKHPLGVDVKQDYVFAVFITEHFPPMLKGLLLSGVLAATMSTLDSTINALSSCITADFFPNRLAKNVRNWMKIDSVIITIILVGISFLASQSEQILTLGLKIASWSGGFLLFCLSFAIFEKYKLTIYNYIFCYLLNLGSIYIFHIIFKWPWQWNAAISLIVSYMVMKIYLLFNKSQKLR